MGFFSKIFKSVKKVFTGIGKGIKKAFTAVGKFTNKLGIVGQIGMMFVAPAIAGWAMKGLTTLGSGFMTGGFMTGLKTAAEGTGFLSGVAKVTHGVFSTAANIASAGVNIYNNITGAVSNVFKGITNGLKGALGIPVKTSVSETLSSASNILSDYSQMRTVDPYAIAGKVATPDPYDTLRRGISLDKVFDSSEGLIGDPRVSRGPPPPPDITPLRGRIWSDITPTDAEKALADFNASAAAGSEIAEIPIATTEPLVTAVVPSEPGIVQKAFRQGTSNLVQKGVHALMAPPIVEPPPYEDYSQHVADKTSLYARSLAENLARGSGAPLDTLSSSVIGGDWNTMVAYTQEFNDSMKDVVYGMFPGQSKGPPLYQSPLVS